MKTIAIIMTGNFTQEIVGFLSVPDDLDLAQERQNWRQTDPSARLASHWEYRDDYLDFLLKIDGVTRADVEIHEL